MRKPYPSKFTTRGGKLRKCVGAGAGDLNGPSGRLASHVNAALLAIMSISNDRLAFVGCCSRPGDGSFDLPLPCGPASQDAVFVRTLPCIAMSAAKLASKVAERGKLTEELHLGRGSEATGD